MITEEQRLLAGAENLLANCIGVKPGESVLIVKEQDDQNYYDHFVPGYVSQRAAKMGALTSEIIVPFVDGPDDVPGDLNEAIKGADHTIFFARIGDQLRFSTMEGDGTRTMCYALNREFLGSEFCTVPHKLLNNVLAKLEQELSQVKEWRITCPQGTDVQGTCETQRLNSKGRAGFTLFNFPIGTFKPISCKSMQGKVALSKWVTPSGLHRYEPDSLVIEKAVEAIVEQGRIQRFEGDAGQVKKIEAHYDAVSSKFDIDPWVVHSWHAGTNPKTFYDEYPVKDLWRWGNLTFTSPRRVHFHTCGDFAPGEIAWSVFDATVEFDGRIYWDKGEFVFLQREDIQEMLKEYPGFEGAFRARTDIGV